MQLYKHQQKIIDEDPKKCGLFLGTGSGKTRVALLLARGNTLVICPKTQKEDKNWEREAEKLGLDIKLMVISKETFRRDAHELKYIDTVIVDEAETCLGATPNIKWVKKQPVVRASQLFDELCTFIKRISPSRIYLCTATITRSPMTVWGASQVLGKDWNFYEWRQAFYYRLPMPGREVWMAKNDSETKDRLAKAVQSLGYVGRLEDYFDVPEQTYKTEYVELTAEQKKRIKELSIEYPDPLVLVGKKHQVENGTLKGNEFSETEFFGNEKIEKLKDYVIEFPKMVVFAKYKEQIEQIREAMVKLSKKVFILTGETIDRGAMLAEANQCEDYVFICQSQISAGWELPNCPVIVFASLDWSITSYLQGLGRIHRANNLKKNLYIHLVSRNGIDEKVYKCIMNKQDFNLAIYNKDMVE